MPEEHMRTIEIEGMKVEVDLRTAKKIEVFKVGDRVKLLTKDYSGHKVTPGVIVGIDCFKKLPTIVIAYVQDVLSFSAENGTINFAYLNAESKDIEICPMCEDDILPTRETFIKYFDHAIEKNMQTLEQIKDRKEYFLRQYGSTFGAGSEELAEATKGN